MAYKKSIPDTTTGVHDPQIFFLKIIQCVLVKKYSTINIIGLLR